MKLNCSNVRSQPSEVAAKPGQQGIALVITLVMLSVTLVMALAFLALAHRERSSVSTATDTTNAKLAADSGLAAAQAQIIANVLSTNAATFNFGLLISTNYINYNGFNRGVASPTNVNYSHLNLASSPGFTPLAGADLEQNVANLQFLPRVPVFVQTNPGSPLDFRFYLDLNRNGAFDDTAYIDNSFTNGPVSEVGDPQWVGILARPDVTHSPNNQFLSRYSFIAIPVGNGLDINAIHNQTQNQNLNLGQDGFYRNESVGSWEINLAAFLADLNSDEWNPNTDQYLYSQWNNNANSGAAFEDAFSILTNRYAGNYNTLAIPNDPLIVPPGTVTLYDSLVNEGIDGYTAGKSMTGTKLPPVYNSPKDTPWAGSDNINHFYNLPSELFNTNETSISFVRRLTAAGNSIATNYDRYTFYHLLAQMGTDSDPDDGKMNLNYRNITNGVVVPNMETNCIVWSPVEFFTNAADRMLRLYSTNWFAANPDAYVQTYYGFNPGLYYHRSAQGDIVTNDPTGFGLTNASFSPYLGWTNVAPGFGITNIPVYIGGAFVYSPAVNRVLQLAANLYDASTTNLYPSVFRPIFEMDQFTNLFIVGFTNVVTVISPVGSDFQFTTPYDVTQMGAELNSGFFKAYTPYAINIYGVPWIIGAKKNLPAFNQLSMVNMVEVDRKLQVIRAAVDSPIYTNHLYLLSITNSLGASFWNSYSNDYSNDYSPQALGNNLSVIFSDYLQITLTNSDRPGVNSSLVFSNYLVYNTNFWPGSHWSRKIGEAPASDSFVAASWTNTFFSQVVYKTGAKVFAQLTDPDPWESNNTSCDPLPQFGLMTTNWMRAIIVDSGHVIDYVQLRGPIDGTNFTSALADPAAVSGLPYLWATNGFNGSTAPSWGYVNQINISKGNLTPPTGASARWQPENYPGNLTSVSAATAYFNAFFTPSHQMTYQGQTYFATGLVVQAGYTATRTAFVPYLYQVNDPMVHYLASDLDAGNGAVWDNGPVPNGVWAQNNAVPPPPGEVVGAGSGSFPIPIPPYGVDIIKGRYQPWGAAAPTTLQTASYNFGNPYNLIYKDPGVWDADYWNFPTNRYPTVGWIGRVHRGSPWQTVYLKATDVVVAGSPGGTNTWAAWTGDRNLYDAANSAPVQDRLLFDLFTARANDNAARGTLSVNQTNLAAWSAIFSDMVVLSNIDVLPSFTLKSGNPIPQVTNTYNLIQPVAVDGINSALGRLVASINLQRTNTIPLVGFTNSDGVVGAFEHAGDILSTPALSVNSPFLNWSNNFQQAYGLNDEDYEWVPQQMMGLVRGSSTPRYVVYAYGQSLRPAPNGLDSSSPYFGLVTNYQVVAESAVRAVISVQSKVDMSGAYPVTNYITHVESYNVLPPN